MCIYMKDMQLGKGFESQAYRHLRRADFATVQGWALVFQKQQNLFFDASP